jgi:hypothetical protein
VHDKENTGREQFNWENFEHPSYSPDLAPSDYHLFLHLKKFLAAQCLRSDQETKDVVRDQLGSLAVTLCNEGVQLLVPR